MVAISFPASPSVNDTFTANGKTWQWNGTFWCLVVSGASVADGSVSTAKIADSAITAAKIADGTIVAAEIANNAITTDKIASDAVTTAKILNANVTTAKVAANAITQAKLASNLSAVTVTTTANRDTDIPSPFTGQLAVLTDTRKIQLYDGTSWVNVSLAPPETPTSLSTTALSTTSVSIAFTAGGANGSPITNYKYALSTNGGSTYGSFIAVDPADITTPITISGLTVGTAYYIKLKAVNDMGDSVASAAVSISTLATPDAPTSLSATPGSTTVAISFTPGSDNGFAITNYQYSLSTNSGSTYGSFTALDPADATSPITITGLTAETAYYVKLKGVNSGGAGAESSAVSFTTTPLLTVDYLVVAGGGGSGGRWHGAGGGAGGLRSTVTATGGGGALETALGLDVSTNYSVSIGGGGAGGPFSNASGVAGSNTSFGSITSTGGGYGAGYNTQGGPGGSSGGGGGATSSATTTGGTRTASPVQGYTGGGSSNAGNGPGAGGGGAGGNGASVSGEYNAVAGGNGGIGAQIAITGSSVYYAGGGGGGGGAGGGAGGLGGGGSGYTAGTTNTGGGGGGATSENPGTGSSGGSGVVILRYPSYFTITLGAGITGTTATVSSNKVTTITAGSGNVSWA